MLFDRSASTPPSTSSEHYKRVPQDFAPPPPSSDVATSFNPEESLIPTAAESAPASPPSRVEQVQATAAAVAAQEEEDLARKQELERGRKRDERVESHHRKPDLRIHHTEPVLYLPPLLSRLPNDNGDLELGSASSAQSDSRSQNAVPSSSSSSSTTSGPVFTSATLPSLDPVSHSLHRALHSFRAVTLRYASVPISEAFNWDELELPVEEEREWYGVAFRSRRKPGSESISLYEADRRAHEEAITNGGLILYWYGLPDPTTGLNLATCIWQSRAAAIKANSRPDHVAAVRLAAASYERYDLERYVVRKYKGDERIYIEEYRGGEVGF